MNKIIEMISASDGSGISTMRVLVAFVVLAVLFNWIYLTVHTGQKQPLDWEEVGLVFGALGAKVAQRQIEKPKTDPAPPAQ